MECLRWLRSLSVAVAPSSFIIARFVATSTPLGRRLCGVSGGILDPLKVDLVIDLLDLYEVYS